MKFSTHTNAPADALVWAQSYRFQTLASRNTSESISVVPSCQVLDHLFTTALGKSYRYRYHFKQNSFMKNPNFCRREEESVLPLLKYSLHVIKYIDL